MAAIPQRILVCRIDNLGDVVMALPALRWLKLHHPALRIEMVVRDYARALTQSCPSVDRVWLPEEVAQAVAAGEPPPDAVFHLQSTRPLLRDCARWRIPVRVGNLLRSAHWFRCNRWVAFSKRRMREHESHLAWRFFAGTFTPTPTAQEWASLLLQGGWLAGQPAQPQAAVNHESGASSPVAPVVAAAPGEPVFAARAEEPVSPRALRVLVHPGSNGNGRQWPLQHFAELVRSLHALGHHVAVTGAPAERAALAPLLAQLPAGVDDLVGRHTLAEFMQLIAQADCLVASGTGPLHMASASGTHAVGIFPPRPPIDAARWRPIGPRVSTLQAVKSGPCTQACSNLDCACMAEVSAAAVRAAVLAGAGSKGTHQTG